MLTAISRPTKAKKMAIGSNATINMNRLDVKIGHSIPLKILSSVWPATIYDWYKGLNIVFFFVTK
jgi:hypothetical protein